MHQKSIVFDMDGTICEPDLSYQETNLRYGSASPIQSTIDRMRFLHEAGYHIIIHTARRMRTHNGDIEKIKNDVEELTRDWLDTHMVAYDELIFGKPYASTFYVDDKAMNVDELDEWIRV